MHNPVPMLHAERADSSERYPSVKNTPSYALTFQNRIPASTACLHGVYPEGTLSENSA